MVIFSAVFIIALLILVQVQFSFFTPRQFGLSILMYHKVSTDVADGLTVTVEQLKQQFDYIRQQGYNVVSFNDILTATHPRPWKHPLILTFDDGYENNAQYLFPLLKEYGFKATVFLPVKHIGGINEWDKGNAKIMNFSALRETSENEVEYGLHSFAHMNFRHMPLNKIEEDIKLCMHTLTENNIGFVPVIAYPYGGFPREKQDYMDFQKVLSNLGVKYGVRIGNRINKLPIADPYLLKRIDIKGSDSFRMFKMKLKKGRIKMF